MPTWPSPRSEQLGAPNPPAIRFARGSYFGASRFTHLLRPAKLLAPQYGSDRYARPPGAFTSRLPTDRLPSPLLDITTTATGLLCWRDFHPLEWQLASLHQIRTSGIPAYGLYGAFLVNRVLAQHDLLLLSSLSRFLFLGSTRAASILPSRPHISIVARSGGQRRRFFSAAGGLSLTAVSTAGIL